MEKKITKAMKAQDIIAMLKGESVKNGTTVEMAVEYLQHEIDLMAKKSTSKSQKTKISQDDLTIIYNFLLEKEEGATCTDIMNELDYPNTQKVRAYLKPLIDEGKVVSEKAKGGKMMFKAVGQEGD